MYLPVVIAVIAIVCGVIGTFRVRRGRKLEAITPGRSELRAGFLVVFGALTLAMYLKGVVRVAGSQIYLAIPPALLCIAVLVPRLHRLPAFLGPCGELPGNIVGLYGCIRGSRSGTSFQSCSTLGCLSSCWRAPEADCLRRRPRGRKTTNPLTRGICFIPQPDRFKPIEFIDSLSLPGQTLFVGQPHSDRMFAIDNLTYFATQRMAATHWHHLDPFLQNRQDIQLQMIQDLERNRLTVYHARL